MRLFPVFLLGLLLAASAADARMHAPYRGHRIVPAGGGSATDDPGLAGAYSLRKVKSGYAGASVRLRRTSDSVQQDIGFVGVELDTGSATTFCAATTCYVAKWYDQSGNLRDIVNATNSATFQPAFVFGCVGGRPCVQVTTATHSLTSVNWTPVLPVSISRVSSRPAGTSSCTTSSNGGAGNRLIDRNPAGYTLSGSAGAVSVTAGDINWHTAIGAVAGAASYLADNGVATTGSVTGTTTTGPMYLAGPGSTTCNFVEFLLWSGTALSAAQMVALDADQRNYWIPLPLDNFTAPAGAYSMRRLKSAYAGPAVKLRRTTGGISDIGFTAAGDFDTAAAQTFCAATTCFLDTWYDQSGNAWHASAGAVNQPAFVFNCIGTQPCARSSANNQFLQTVSVAWASAVSSFSAVGMRSAGAASCWLAQKGANNSFGFNNSANNWVVSDNIANFFPMAAADSVWHAGVGIIAAAASLGRIDATEIAGVNIPGTSAAATLNIIYSAGGDTCSTTEILVWDGYALTLPERQALVANQRAYWGF